MNIYNIYNNLYAYYFKDNMFESDHISSQYIEILETENTRETLLFDKHHSIFDIPAHISYINNIKIEKWYRFGELYRDEGPTTIITNEDNTIEHIWNDKIVIYHANGNIKSKTWLIDGLEDRYDKEYTYLSYYEDGTLKTMKRHIKGELTSIDDLPAIIKYKKNKIERYWYSYGKLHRYKKPSIIIETNKYTSYYWYYYGSKMNPHNIKFIHNIIKYDDDL